MAVSAELERALALLPASPPWLAGDRLRAWKERRRIIGGKHRGWREASAGLAHLFDDDEQHRRALAASLAREMGELLEEAGAHGPGGEPVAVWMQQVTFAWVQVVRLHDGDGGEPGASLAAFVEEFAQREHQRVLGRARPVPAASSGGLRRLSQRLLAAARRALFPGL